LAFGSTMALVELARFESRVRADLARMRLEADGLTAILFDEGMSDLGLGSIMPIRLMVLDEEYDEAKRLLAEEGLL